MESPKYTMATLMPSTLPLSWAGKTEVRMAMEVPKIMALPRPSTTREAISICTLLEILHRSDDTTMIDSPSTNIFFLPNISAMRPKGTTKTAAESRKPVTIQPRSA